MNHVRIDSSHIVRSLRNFGICFLLLLCCFAPVKAEVTVGAYGNTFGSNVDDIISQFGLSEGSATPSGSLYNNAYYRFRVISSGSSYSNGISYGNSALVPVNVVYWFPSSSSTSMHVLFFYDGDAYPDPYVTVAIDRSSDGVIWSQSDYANLNQSYTYTQGSNPRKIYYIDLSGYTNWYPASSILSSSTGFIPVIRPENNSITSQSVLAVFSGNLEYRPWRGSTSSGGRYWSDGTELSPENSNKYSQVYLVMDSNNDNSVTQEEVNYYNYTYNTDYDYSAVNNSNNFNENEFLYWVAKQIEVGVENPGGGTGSGSGGSGGGITVTDSFNTQQQQYQTIEENAVNVTVNNNNALTQENYQELNSLINNYNGSSEDETDPFQQAVSNFQAFHAIALAFAGLASIVFGWLPWWVTALLGAMFSMVCVFIVLRLIHLFK